MTNEAEKVTLYVAGVVWDGLCEKGVSWRSCPVDAAAEIEIGEARRGYESEADV